MTLNSISLNFREFLGISHISDATAAKRMKIDQYCQRQRCTHVEWEQYLTCFRVARVCQRQLGFFVFHQSSVKLKPNFGSYRRDSSYPEKKTKTPVTKQRIKQNRLKVRSCTRRKQHYAKHTPQKTMASDKCAQQPNLGRWVEAIRAKRPK